MISLMWAAVVAFIYASCSIVLLKQPVLMFYHAHAKKKLQFLCKHISHRGGAGEQLENTLTAYRNAVKAGTDMLELDCQLTRDGRVVVCHDNDLTRVSGQAVFISDTAYRDLPLMKDNLPLDFDPDYIYRASPDGDRRIPLLSEVFDEFPNMPINVDVKTTSRRLMLAIESLIRQYKREEITVWGNYRDDICLSCYDANARIPLLFSLKSVFRLLLLFYSGLLPFVELKESCLEIPMVNTFLSREQEQGMTRHQRMLLCTVDKLLMRKALFLHLRKRGIQVYVWVLNTEAEFERAFSCGATGVMTDFPAKLRRWLDAHPQYPLPVD